MAPTANGAEASRRTKRSATVSLVLLVGAGAAALALGRLDPSQREEDALIYGNDGECAAQGLRPEAECAAEYRAALASYAASAPRYETREDCERHHGPSGCTMPEADTPGIAAFVPVMAGYMMGRTAAQGLPTQPLYRHAPEEEQVSFAGGGGGYCTGAGGTVWRASGGTAARVPSTVARTTTATPRTISRGGFGGTGRATAFSSGGRSFGSAG